VEFASVLSREENCSPNGNCTRHANLRFAPDRRLPWHRSPSSAMADRALCPEAGHQASDNRTLATFQNVARDLSLIAALCRQAPFAAATVACPSGMTIAQDWF
jgi:hypothetical protein